MNEIVGPLSKNLKTIETKDFWITCASWDTGYGPSYEIGVRRKSNDNFTLIQSGWNSRTVLVAAVAIEALLNAGYGPAEVQEIFP